MTRKKRQRDPLVGKFFHRPVDGSMANGNQGVILRKIDQTHYLIQLFSWLDGRPTTQQVVALDSVTTWTFYDDHEAWVSAGDAMAKRATRTAPTDDDRRWKT